METITGMELNYSKMTGEVWALYFTGGVYQGDGVRRTVEPAIIRLNKKDYDDYQHEVFDIYYNPIRNMHSVIYRADGIEPANICDDNGYHLGGFLVNDCELRYMYPISDDVEYIRGFEDESHSEGFIDDSTPIDLTQPLISPFNFDFSNDFQTGESLDVPQNGEFDDLAFDSAFAIIEEI